MQVAGFRGLLKPACLALVYVAAEAATYKTGCDLQSESIGRLAFAG
jgi:hypothetical protein